MNRQQAINYLSSSGFSEEQINTIEQAFKQEPTTKNDLGVMSELEKNSKKLEKDFGESDCISRQAVFELIADYDLSMGQVVRGIHALPSVTPQEPKTEWIPVSERLPEKNVEVLVTTEWSCITIGEMFSNNDWFIHEGATSTNIDDIKAWMPLPKPYSEVEQ